VNETPASDRDELRAHVIGVLREEVPGGEVVDEDKEEEPIRQAGFNPLGFGIPVLLVGAFLLFLFPPVGLLLFAMAAFLMIWGIVATLFGGRTARRGCQPGLARQPGGARLVLPFCKSLTSSVARRQNPQRL